MKGFILGVLATLAVLNPVMTKAILASTVDTTHSVMTNIMNNTQEESK
jgi:hypothetical protein